MAIVSIGNSQMSINKFMNEFKKDENTYGLKINGGLINSAIKSSVFNDKHDDIDVIEKLGDKIKKVRILFNTKANYDFSPILTKFYSSLANQKMEKLLSIKNGKEVNIDVILQQDKNIIKNLVFVLNTEDAKGILLVETDITEDEFNKIDFSFNKPKNN
jgi:hypothetical protein